MEDHKRLLLPAIAAIVLHGLLISLQLSKHVPVKPTLMGNPIRVEINAFSSKAPAPEKNQAGKPAETISPVTSHEKIVREKVSAPPIVLQQQRQKKPIKPDLTKQSAVAANTVKAIAPQRRQVEKQIKDMAGSSSATAVTAAENRNREMNKDQPQATNSAVPIHRQAIPVYRQNKQPSYPAMAKRRGYEGEVLLNVLVNSQGRVAEIKIHRSSGHQSLDTAALDAVRNWLFTPATDGGRPLSMWVTVPIEFRLLTNRKS